MNALAILHKKSHSLIRSGPVFVLWQARSVVTQHREELGYLLNCNAAPPGVLTLS